MGKENDKVKKITFFLKNDVVCPACNNTFKREELFSGGGRLIAGGITSELRRQYEPSKIYGKINPMIYPITVCPKCYLASFHEDFNKLKIKGVEKAKISEGKRSAIINKMFPGIDFTQLRTTRHGAASYILSVECYDYFDKWVSPTIKKAICAIRAAWLFSDMEIEDPMADYGNLQNLFYKKALQLYIEVLTKQERAEESFDGIKHLGPDTDVNYGYDGILYLIGALTYKISFLEKHTLQTVDNLEKAKRVISKMFGHGKASKDKPSIIIDMARDLYDEISNKTKEIITELGPAMPSQTASPPASGSSLPSTADGTSSTGQDQQNLS